MRLHAQQAAPALETGTEELFFIISPPRHIVSDVSVLKDDIQYLIGRPTVDRHTKAHIALFRYSDTDIRMHHMLRFVEARAKEIEPFNIFLKDFGALYDGSKRHIYLDVVNKSPIQELFEKIVREDPAYPHPDRKEPFRPGIPPVLAIPERT
jgi:2'-5' RNA ligase